jgi:hypothetical protein
VSVHALTREARVLDRGRPAQCPWSDVVEFDLEGRAADAAVLHLPLAAASVADPDRPPHVRGDVIGVRARRGRRLPRLRHDPLPLRGAVEEEVEAGLEDLLGGRAGIRVREGVPGGVELGEEAAGHGDVEAGEVRRDRICRVARSRTRWRRLVRGGERQFNWLGAMVWSIAADFGASPAARIRVLGAKRRRGSRNVAMCGCVEDHGRCAA